MIRRVLWLLLLHHIPGQCAPKESEDGQSAAGEHEHTSGGRVRKHLLGGAGNVVTDVRERMIAALEREADDRAQVLAWAAREAIETAPATTGLLRATVDEIRQAVVRKTRKSIR